MFIIKENEYCPICFSDNVIPSTIERTFWDNDDLTYTQYIVECYDCGFHYTTNESSRLTLGSRDETEGK